MADNVINCLVAMLAVIAGVVAVGLIAGFSMQPFIIMYWLVLLMKNLCDIFMKRFGGK